VLVTRHVRAIMDGSRTRSHWDSSCLRPGRDSRTLKTGFQYEPVDSIATMATPWTASQSERASKSAVMVAKVPIDFETLPAGSTLRTQAATARLWTSKPPQLTMHYVH
jgi:hypothetical protein